MPIMKATHPVTAGVDVSRKTLSVCILDSSGKPRHLCLDNDPAGIRQAVDHLAQVALVTLEPTSVYHRPLVRALQANAIACSLPNPRKTRDFGKAMGLLAKTDALDAHGLALFGRRMDPHEHPMPDEAQQQLQALATRRLQLLELRTAEINRMHDATLDLLVESHRAAIGLFDAQIRSIEAELERRIAQSEELARKRRILESAPGVGFATAAILIALLPELGRFDGKQVSALVGLAPVVRQSGQWQGKATIAGGRTHVRCALYMASLSAIRHNPPIRDFYKRLRSAGKPPKQALTAAAHKLLLQLNAMMAKNEPFRNAQNP